MAFIFKRARGWGGSRVQLSGFGRRLRDESDFPLLLLLCALWEVMSIQYVHPPPFLMAPPLRSKRVPIKASETDCTSAGAQRVGRISQRHQFIYSEQSVVKIGAFTKPEEDIFMSFIVEEEE